MERDFCLLFVVLVAAMSLCNSKRTLEEGRTKVVKREDKSVPSIEFLLKISNSTVDDLIQNYVDGYEGDTNMRRLGGDVRPKPAFCKPELKTVQLVNNLDPNTIYLPSCTRLEQCGGCCSGSNNLLACEPKETETVSFKILKTQFAPGGRLTYRGKKTVRLERHTKCECGCRIKKKDCNAFQDYHENECRCVCTNNDEEKKCNDNNAKMWNPETCKCTQP